MRTSFLQEARAMEPRLKGRPLSDASWDGLRKEAVEANVTGATPRLEEEPEEADSELQQQQEEEESEGGTTNQGGAVLRGQEVEV
ncbi:hypothetical protein VZT92_001928 [Zoarces viviparus]|uniref:Uncharacterized protein n=1 Tax=Zoarces viviparus TaxID=48416 RepID=A0AAW1G6W3_ZOAVI